jgi:hypothetical protein
MGAVTWGCYLMSFRALPRRCPTQAAKPLQGRWKKWASLDYLHRVLPTQQRCCASVPCVRLELNVPSNRCKQCDQPLVEIDHYGERLTGCPSCNRWQAVTGVRGQKLNVSRLGIVGDLIVLARVFPWSVIAVIVVPVSARLIALIPIAVSRSMSFVPTTRLAAVASWLIAVRAGLVARTS